MDDFDLTTIMILLTVDITGALIYSSLDPKGDNWSGESQYEEDDYRIKESATVWNFLVSWAIHSFFIFTWIVGLININSLKRKGMYFNLLKNDARHLSQCIDVYLFSEIEKMDEKDVDKQIDNLERLYNIYGLQKTWTEKDDPYKIKYRLEARQLFKRRIKLKEK